MPFIAKVSCPREPACACQTGAWASSAGYTATPEVPSASMAAPFSRATASTLAMNSWCSRCALFTRLTVGAAMRASSAISPGWFMPSSITAAWCQRVSSWRRRSTVSGTPMWLLKLPSVANAPSPHQACRMQPSICVTVVLPLLPVTAISGSWKRVRHPAASCCKRAQAVADQQTGQAGLGQAALGERRRGTRAARLRQEVVGVEAFAAQRDEQIAGAQAARVAVHAGEHACRVRPPASIPAATRAPR